MCFVIWLVSLSGYLRDIRHSSGEQATSDRRRQLFHVGKFLRESPSFLETAQGYGIATRGAVPRRNDALIS